METANRFLSAGRRIGMTGWVSHSEKEVRLAAGEPHFLPIPVEPKLSFRMKRSGMRNLIQKSIERPVKYK